MGTYLSMRVEKFKVKREMLDELRKTIEEMRYEGDFLLEDDQLAFSTGNHMSYSHAAELHDNVIGLIQRYRADPVVQVLIDSDDGDDVEFVGDATACLEAVRQWEDTTVNLISATARRMKRMIRSKDFSGKVGPMPNVQIW